MHALVFQLSFDFGGDSSRYGLGFFVFVERASGFVIHVSI
jgi:hypothetical protein